MALWSMQCFISSVPLMNGLFAFICSFFIFCVVLLLSLFVILTLSPTIFMILRQFHYNFHSTHLTESPK
jgi:ABC-type transport system involved in cytochrome bd biosynthesis fused ATPase/permease subunit